MIRYSLPTQSVYEYDRYMLVGMQFHNESIRFKNSFAAGKIQEQLRSVRERLTKEKEETVALLNTLAEWQLQQKEVAP